MALACALSGCSGCASYRRCSAPPAAQLAALPARLSETGLFVAGDGETLGPGVRAYAPAYPLWSDGASKRRSRPYANQRTPHLDFARCSATRARFAKEDDLARLLTAAPRDRRHGTRPFAALADLGRRGR